MSTITVDLGARSYPVIIESGLLQRLPEVMDSLTIQGRIGLVSNAPVHALYGSVVEDALTAAGCQLTTALVPEGEQIKSLETAAGLYDSFLQGGLDRSSTIVALGGGVIGDLAGFVAATLFRGINFVQIPTSLLAMVDASIGGKTGVNHPLGKNLIGAFHQPQAVLIDPELVRSLPHRELTSAFAEILKAGAIADRDFYISLANNAESMLAADNLPLLSDAIERACRIKAEVVSADEREGDRRRLLNFGHTIGHALETALGYGQLRHGEAVALGMHGAGVISRELAGLPEDDLRLLLKPLGSLNLPALPPLNHEAILGYLRRDKKMRHGQLHFVLLERIGQPIISTAVRDRHIRLALERIEEE
ncbi:MAG: 3-dehydroquinate synthase, partial [Candidatus Marinimicrobia bacterium]|nr:3-dehydroquinate synthase [Candidatus Neomarinimicrobiota bacterium]